MPANNFVVDIERYSKAIGNCTKLAVRRTFLNRWRVLPQHGLWLSSSHFLQRQGASAQTPMRLQACELL
jgi:hypothetical protein